MHSNEPIEPRFVDDPSQQQIADAPWRAEVASRVCSYHARRKRRYAGEDSPALDFGPAAGGTSVGAQTFDTQSPVFPSTASQGSASQNVVSASQPAPGRVASQGAEARNQAHPARNAIVDTNYYRRLNAESMAQGSSVRLGAAVAATAPALEPEAEFWVRSNAMSEAECEDAVRDPLTDREAEDDDPALDLEIRPAAAEDSFLDRYCISGPEPESVPPAAPMPMPMPRNLIVFPRPFLEPPLLPQPCRDELAEPMNRRPRILEVPEDIMPVVQGSLFPEIRLDGDEEEGASSREPEIEIPLRVAPVSARLMAGLTDWGVAMAAGLLFAAMAWRALPDVPHAKPFWMMLGAVTLLLWAVYQHLFLLYAGRTPGMRMRGIRLSTFDGQPPPWKQRRRRARFMVISFAAVTLGFVWALVDEDALCWHDRVSQTFPTTE